MCRVKLIAITKHDFLITAPFYIWIYLIHFTCISNTMRIALGMSFRTDFKLPFFWIALH